MTIMISDLEATQELDRKAMASTRGGHFVPWGLVKKSYKQVTNNTLGIGGDNFGIAVNGSSVDGNLNNFVGNTFDLRGKNTITITQS